MTIYYYDEEKVDYDDGKKLINYHQFWKLLPIKKLKSSTTQTAFNVLTLCEYTIKRSRNYGSSGSSEKRKYNVYKNEFTWFIVIHKMLKDERSTAEVRVEL